MQWIYHGEQSHEVIYNEDENEEHDNDDEIQTMLEEAQTQHAVEIDYSDDDFNQEDDTIIEYISDYEENEGNNSTNDDEVDSTFDGDDIGCDVTS
uniref:Uncharacterized protein n=1 Tax=Solanum tuberosum TaxID=4113 RepID=M1DYL9_SOLTU